jgi:hypothetical protein
MAKTNEHGRLIAAAAKAALGPLGCKRKGQSRFWYSDQRFWIISIEFQPSGWSKGSYLNVAPNWLWSPGAEFGFSDDARIEDAGFISFKSVEQFTPLIAAMAERAAREILKLRRKFKSIDHIYEHLLTRAGRNGWPTYHAAVAAALTGDIARARWFFDRLAAWDTYGNDWPEKSYGAALAKLLDDPLVFRSTVLKFIADARERVRLPPEADLWRTMGSINEASNPDKRRERGG